MKKINKEATIAFVKKYKIQLIILLVVIIALVIGLIISFNFDKVRLVKKDDQKIIANTSADIIKEEVYENLKFTNISLITENGYSTFSADVTNISQTNSDISDVYIILQDKKGNEIITLRGNIGEPLKPNETRTITAVTKGELINVTSKVIAKYENNTQN